MHAQILVHATVTAPWGDVSDETYVGSLDEWAWEDRKARAPWLKVRRAMVLSEHTIDPKAPGWRVDFRAEAAGDDE